MKYLLGGRQLLYTKPGTMGAMFPVLQMRKLKFKKVFFK